MKTASNSRFLRIIPLVLIVGLLCSSAYGKTIYVDDDAMGANDGTSWENAYNFLQDALADANSAAKPVEIQVAQGVYTPDSNSAMPDGTGDMEVTFNLINGVTLRGGYAGIAEPDPDARDVAAYETILSGDLNGDDEEVAAPLDLLYEPNRAENNYHVVTGSSTDQTAVLDGFAITGGNADGPTFSDEWPWGDAPPWDYRLKCGSGMYNYEGSPTLTNCTFSGNLAIWEGSGMYNYESSPTLTNCTFMENSAIFAGGGMCNEGESSPTLMNCTFRGNSVIFAGGGMQNWRSSPTLTDCTFIGNSAKGSETMGVGGGMDNQESSNPTLTNCTFSENSAEYGGGMHNVENSPTLTNCTFSRNSAREGGGIQNAGSNPTLTNCTFKGNLAYHWGGGMYNWYSSPTLTNCTFSGNSAYRDDGGGMYNRCCCPTLTNCTFSGNSAEYGGGMENYGSNPTLTNCILWGNAPEQISGDAAVTYSDVQGGWPGQGNIDTDPLFVDLGYWDPNGTPADESDDYWVNGDYHLRSQAGRWDPNSQTWVQDDVTSPCIDAGDPLSPVMYEPHPRGCIINMGAYGGTEEASKSPFSCSYEADGE